MKLLLSEIKQRGGGRRKVAVRSFAAALIGHPGGGNEQRRSPGAKVTAKGNKDRGRAVS